MMQGKIKKLLLVLAVALVGLSPAFATANAPNNANQLAMLQQTATGTTIEQNVTGTGLAPKTDHYNAEVPQVTTSRCLTNNGNPNAAQNNANTTLVAQRRRDDDGRTNTNDGTPALINGATNTGQVNPTTVANANDANGPGTTAMTTNPNGGGGRTMDDEGRLNNGPNVTPTAPRATAGLRCASTNNRVMRT